MTTKYATKSVLLELKSDITVEGKFSGYGSVFNVIDQGSDIVESGAFGKSLDAWKSNGRQVPVLWQHKSDEPIGSWEKLSEDKHGLLGDAELWLADAPYARLAHRGMKSKTITGLSIGYRIVADSFDKKTGVNRLHELDLVEISVVTNPMNDAARIGAVKSINRILKEGGLPSLREFEDFLCEAGFSNSQAKAVTGNGLTKLLGQREVDGDAENEALIKLLQSYTPSISTSKGNRNAS